VVSWIPSEIPSDISNFRWAARFTRPTLAASDSQETHQASSELSTQENRMGNTDDPRHASLPSPSTPVYAFTTAELARLAHYRAAVHAGFYNDAVSQVAAAATGRTSSSVL
jgi:hypothetical protein